MTTAGLHVQTLTPALQQQLQFNNCLQWMQVVESDHLANLAIAVVAGGNICFLAYFADASLPMLQAHLCALLYWPYERARSLVGLCNKLMEELLSPALVCGCRCTS